MFLELSDAVVDAVAVAAHLSHSHFLVYSAATGQGGGLVLCGPSVRLGLRCGEEVQVAACAKEPPF